MKRQLLITLVILLTVVLILCLAFIVAMNCHQRVPPKTESSKETTENVMTGTTGTTPPDQEPSFNNTAEENRKETEATESKEIESSPAGIATSHPATESVETTAPTQEETKPTTAATEETEDPDELPIVPNA